MAKKSRSLSFKNATINSSDMTIVEYTIDETLVYRIEDILAEWDGIDGISLVIKSETVVEALDEDKDGEDE